MKVLVCGGRKYSNWPQVQYWLNRIHKHSPITHIINGDAKGADALSTKWAERNSVPVTSYPADWDLHGKSAGPRRNALMLKDNPDIACVIAFPGGRGTYHMVSLAKKSDIPVIQGG